MKNLTALTEINHIMNFLTFKPLAFAISSAGLLLLLWSNLSALFGLPQPPVELSFPRIFAVLFPLWAYTIFYLNQIHKSGEQKTDGLSLPEKILYLLGNPPAWTFPLLTVVYLYGFYSLFLLATGALMDPELVNGQYQIFNHGEITTFTEEEYLVRHALHLRGITGFFLSFFMVSTLVLAPWKRGQD